LAARGAELLAVDPETFPLVVGWRSDFGAARPHDAFGPGILGVPADWGVELPDGATSISATGLLVPETWADRETQGPQDPVRLMARFVDERGRFRVHVADASFNDEGWSTARIDLSGLTARGGALDDAESLVLQALWVERDGATGAAINASRVLLDDWVVSSPAGTESIQDEVDTEFSAQSGLVVEEVEGDTAADI